MLRDCCEQISLGVLTISRACSHVAFFAELPIQKSDAITCLRVPLLVSRQSIGAMVPTTPRRQYKVSRKEVR
jgi:hypothetical protein